MGQEYYDWESIETVIEKYSAMLYKIAYSHTGNKEDAEDILQETMIKYARQKKFKDEEHQKAWLIRVTINQSINLVKSAQKRKNVSLTEQGVTVSESREENEVIKTLVMELPLKYRAAIYLYYYEGYKVDEIAVILKKKTTGVYSLLNRGRKMLREKMEEGGLYDESDR